MFNDYNELFTTELRSENDFDRHNNIFYSDAENESEKKEDFFELNFMDLEPIVPYETFSLSLRKDIVRERFGFEKEGYDLKTTEKPGFLNKSLVSAEYTDVDHKTGNDKSLIMGNCNVLENSFITHNDDFILGKREQIDIKEDNFEILETKNTKVQLKKPELKTKKENIAKRVKKAKKACGQKCKKTKKKEEKKPLHKCKCTKSKCLRLYCQCFAKGLICGVDCDCTDCHNKDEFKTLRDLVIQETIEKNPYAFKSKYKKHEEKNNILHSRGCNCSKTGCIKEYCECFKAGTGCSRLCRCVNCKNDKIEIKDDEVKIYYDRVLRKRKKKSILKECFSNKKEILNKLNLKKD